MILFFRETVAGDVRTTQTSELVTGSTATVSTTGSLQLVSSGAHTYHKDVFTSTTTEGIAPITNYNGILANGLPSLLVPQEG